MNRISNDSLAILEYELTWQSKHAKHVERYLGRKVNIWRDMFPPALISSLKDKKEGDTVTLKYAPGEAIPGYDSKHLLEIPLRQFQQPVFNSTPIPPGKGRFFPRKLFGNLPGVSPGDGKPARITRVDTDKLTVDLNHPLAGYPLTLTTTIHKVIPRFSDTGGRVTSWMEEITDNGPGMQAGLSRGNIEYTHPKAFTRKDESEDPLFYQAPRFIGHVDQQAGRFIRESYGQRLKNGMLVLDLMSGYQSHLPDNLQIHVTGLGLNLEEMKANPCLNTCIVHDINRNPELPFDKGYFDCVLLSLSVEYLVNPWAVFQEISRVLQPGGTFLISFSNRWFPHKVINLWTELHEFERMGFVSELLLSTQSFTDIETLSIRNWWRPEDDPHIHTTRTSDPIYIVAGIKRYALY